MEKVLEAQLAYLRSDERIVERARQTLSVTPQERLRLLSRLCEDGAQLAPGPLPEHEPLSPDAEAALLRLARG